MMRIMTQKNILLIISGGIAAYKSLDLIRRLKKDGLSVRCILTKGGERFVTPLSVSALSENPVYTDLWSLKDEVEMGHIRLSREADLIVIAPASADLIGKMANGLADDLASTTLLAANKPIMMAPAMNHEMWNNPSVQKIIKTLQDRGITLIGPEEGDMACGEYGIGRMSEPEDITRSITDFFFNKPLKGLKALVTSGPTYEALDPVRFIGNRSSGKQGHAIASELAQQGADVTLVHGPVSIPPPPHVRAIKIETAEQMKQACEEALPCDIAVCAAAVSDWRLETPDVQKIKKGDSQSPPHFQFQETPDILALLSNHEQRPRLVIGFAAETENAISNAKTKLSKKGCDWILANDVSDQKIFGSDETHITLISKEGTEDWGRQSKKECARSLAEKISESLSVASQEKNGFNNDNSKHSNNRSKKEIG